jgi:hypothetical protein
MYQTYDNAQTKEPALSVPNGTLVCLVSLVLCMFAFVPIAQAGPPVHPSLFALNIEGLDHACGTAVDSEGDVYVSSAGESTVKVFDPTHTELTSIANANEPCGLAVDSKGLLYVSEKGTGNVVRYAPNAYPLGAAPIYSAPEAFDSSGNAKGIAVDPADDRLYVAEGTRISVFQSDGTTGQSEVQSVTVDSMVTSGTFTLSFEGQPTAPIPYNVDTSQLQAALQALPAIGAGNISVAEGGFGIRSYRVEFTHALGSTDVSTLSADSSGLSGGSVTLGAPVGAPDPPIQGFAFSGHIGEAALTNATAVAAYTSGSGEFARHYLFAADSTANSVKVFSGHAIDQLEEKTPIDGSTTPQGSFGFGTSGAALATEWASGHLFVYDSAHSVLDEFEAGGRYLDQVSSADFSDGEPTGVAALPERNATQELMFSAFSGSFELDYEGLPTGPIPVGASAEVVQQELEALPNIGNGNVVVRRRGTLPTLTYVIMFTGDLATRGVGNITVDPAALGGGSPTVWISRLPGYGPGRVYVTAGSGTGAKLLTFAPLPPPSRPPLESLSHALATARTVTVDSKGDVYVGAGKEIRVYDPAGVEITKFTDKELPYDLAVDSKGRVYVLDEGKGPSDETEIVTYYTPSSYPPTSATTYSRHEPPIFSYATPPDPGFGRPLIGIAVNPGPSSGKDHLFIIRQTKTIELGSVEDGSPILNSDFASGVAISTRAGIDVYGASGDVYIDTGENAGDVIRVINPAGTELARIDGVGSPGGRFGSNIGITVDQSNGHVLAFDPENNAAREYDATGAFLTEFGNFSGGGQSDIAVDNSGGPNDGTAYIAFDEAKPGTPDLRAFGPLSYGEPPFALTGTPSGLGSGDATLNGTVDPRGFDLESCRFEYQSDDQYLTNGKTFAGAIVKACAESPAAIGAGSKPVAVHADVVLPEPDGRYRYRLVAQNKYGPGEGKASLFGPPVLSTQGAHPVLYDEATLRAQVDPAGLATAYHFEYGPGEGEYDQTTPSAELSPGEEAVAANAALTGLAEGATYHFRAVVENAAKTLEGPDQTLTTLVRRGAEACPNLEFRTGLSANLPDCRAYELVTPAETGGVSPIDGEGAGAFNNWRTPPRGGAAGERLSFFSRNTIPGFDGNGEFDGYRAERGPGAHPSEGWTTRLVGPTYSQSGANGPVGRGVASDQLYSAWGIGSRREAFEDSLPEDNNLRTPGGFEALGRGSLGVEFGANPDFLSAGGAHVVFSSRAHLEEEAPLKGVEAIYDRAAGATSAAVISLRPDGKPFEQDATYVAAVEDGSAVAFKVGGTLYLRRDGVTTEIATGPNAFAGVSTDGRRVFYAGQGSGEAPGALFVCQVEGGSCAGPEATQAAVQIASNAIFVNVSLDGSRVLFTSKDDLTGAEENENGEAAMASQPNLYAWDGTVTRFLGVLDSQDFVEFGEINDNSLSFWTRAAKEELGGSRAVSPTRSTPDGKILVFQSHAQLTSYENEGHGEIYRYAPLAAEGGRLLCVSCDPTGAPPSADATLHDLRPHTAANQRSTLIPNITDDGSEVFFLSADQLLPEDANDVQDVYEWQAQGVGACKRAGGCLALISSGQGEHDNYLFSMSADGHDVFFWTEEKLVGQDVPGSKSIYDARVDGGIPNPPAPAPCQGDACQGIGSTPPALPSALSEEGGNGKQGSSRCAKGQRRVVRRGKSRCIKPHQHKRQAKKRGAGRNRGAQR